MHKMILFDRTIAYLNSFKQMIVKALILLIFLLPKNVNSQLALKQNNSISTQIFKLDALQFQKLLQFQSIHDSLNLFTHFVKNVPIGQNNFIDSLSFGHYLAVNTIGAQVNFRLYSKSFFKLQSFGYNGEIWHIVTDQQGNVIKDAKLSMNTKTYSYQADCNCYPIAARKNRIKDTIKISYLNHFDFYQVTNQFIEQSPYEVKSNKYPKSSPSNIRILPGYVAFNQPIYRKDDTVRVKAFLVNEKGKIWKKRKVLIKYTTPEGKTIVLGKVKRQSEGAYIKDFLVPDSYPYGTYQLSFWKVWDEVKLRSEPFYIEDYQLKPANTYASKTTQKIYHKGQDVEFILKAVDVNGLALLDAKAKVTIQASKITDFYDKKFYWNGKPTAISFEKEVLFDVAGETVVTFPDSLFPNTNMVYKAKVQFYNDLEILYAHTIDFTFDAKPSHFELKIKEDSILVDHFTLGINSPHTQLQLISMRDHEITSSKIIAAPYREKIDLFNTAYLLKDQHGHEIKRLNFDKHQALPVSLSGQRKHDSISIRLINELQMPVSYKIFKRDQQINGGQWKKGDSPMLYQASDATLDDYHVIYSVLWREKHFIKEQIFYTDETKLNVDIKQADIVFPGSKIPVSVNITDYKNQVVEGANITAYAVNDLFNTVPIPNLPYFGRLHTQSLTRFPVQNKGFQFNRTLPLTAEFISKFKLRAVPFYEFAYAENGVGIFQDSIGGDLAELAVYSKNLNQQTFIHAVYLNNEPIAINGTSNSKAYVFSTQAGLYELKIRTKEYLYTIKNISLIAGEKTYLCLNEAFIESNPNVTYLKIGEPPFTNTEWSYLKSSFLLVKRGNEDYVLEQNGFISDSKNLSTNSKLFSNGQWFDMIGPLKKGKIQVLNRKSDTLTNFDFFPGYLYSMDSIGQLIVLQKAPENIQSSSYQFNTLYQDWRFQYQLPKWSAYFPDSVKTKPIQKPAIASKKIKPTSINYENPAREQQLRSFRPETYGQANSGTVSLKNNSGKIIKWVLLHNQNNPKSDGAWYTSRFNYGGIATATYDVMVFFTDSTYVLLCDFEVLAHGNNYYRIDSNEVKDADTAIQMKYEEIIVAANKSPLNTFVNNPLYFEKIHLKTIASQKGQTVLSGFIVNTYNKPLNNINLIFEKAGKFKYGALTNRDGYFELSNVEPGEYTIKIGN